MYALDNEAEHSFVIEPSDSPMQVFLISSYQDIATSMMVDVEVGAWGGGGSGE